jgi:AbiU2
MTEEERRKRLIEWLNIIYKEVQDVLVDDHIFWEIQEIFKANQQLSSTPSMFNQWLASGFVTSAAIAVRRQADKAENCVSLHRFLTELIKFPPLASRLYFVAMYRASNIPPEFAEDMANGDYDRVVGARLSEPDALQVQAEIDELLQKTEQIRHYVDRRQAHYDQRGLQKPLPTFEDLSECLALCERLVKKYKLLLTGAGISTLLPTITYDWKAIFYFPWLKDPRPPKADENP